jgi:hypothetical protein
VGGAKLVLGEKINMTVEEMKKIYQSAIPRRMAQ